MIELPSFRAAEGWRFASAAEWANKPDWTDFIIAPYESSNASGSNHATYRYASEYWSNVTHVDISDAASGNITNGLDIGCASGCVYETWYVRDSVGGQVPEPSSLVLLACGLAALGLRARHHRKA